MIPHCFYDSGLLLGHSKWDGHEVECVVLLWCAALDSEDGRCVGSMWASTSSRLVLSMSNWFNAEHIHGTFYRHSSSRQNGLAQGSK